LNDGDIVGGRGRISAREAHFFARFESWLTPEWTPSAAESITEVALAARGFDLAIL